MINETAIREAVVMLRELDPISSPSRRNLNSVAVHCDHSGVTARLLTSERSLAKDAAATDARGDAQRALLCAVGSVVAQLHAKRSLIDRVLAAHPGLVAAATEAYGAYAAMSPEERERSGLSVEPPEVDWMLERSPEDELEDQLGSDGSLPF